VDRRARQHGVGLVGLDDELAARSLPGGGGGDRLGLGRRQEPDALVAGGVTEDDRGRGAQAVVALGVPSTYVPGCSGRGAPGWPS
jgi:hypothetical protein